MTVFRSFTDFFSIGLSAACAVHCLIWPILAIIFPLIPAFQQDGENFHFSILLFAIPSSVVAMTMGCRLHKTYITLSKNIMLYLNATTGTSY